MPWKEQNTMDQRVDFIRRYQNELISFKQLCSEYNISTKTGYKWRKRYEEEGFSGLEDMSRKPSHHAQQLSEDIIFKVIRLKLLHEDYGYKKIHNVFLRKNKEVISVSSVKRIIYKVGLYEKRKVRHVTPLDHKKIILEAHAPNDIWSIDFKGHWTGRGGSKCEPFTVVDQYSRDILYCLPLEKSNTEHVKATFIELFKKYGLPKVIKSDNGSPFANNFSVRGITKLAAWLISLGIKVHRIQPAKPSQNGKHERMHRDLKRIVQRGSQYTLKEYCERLKEFQIDYNQQRPHEALDMKFPSEVYLPSPRKYVSKKIIIEYPQNFDVRRVDQNGYICFNNKRYKISSSLTKYDLGFYQNNEQEIDVYFCDVLLGTIDMETEQFLKIKRALQVDENFITSNDLCGTLNQKVLPMY